MRMNVLRRWLPALAIAAALVILPLALVWCVGSLSSRADQENLSMAEQAIRRAAVECYALEGWYPDSLDYLVEHYGIRVDTSRYLVDYQFVASNLMPDITVLLPNR